MRRFFGLILVFMTIMTAQAATIGQWNAYLAYHDITDIEPAGKLVYVLSSKDLFSYNVNDKSVYAYNKMNTLSDTEIDFIAWNNTAKKLIIVYSNFNIDLLDNNFNTENISDYYSKAMTLDKTVNNVTISGNYAYLSTGFGIIKLNMKDAEITETYILGKNTQDCAVKGSSLFAKTSEGIYEGKTTDNLVDPSNWKLTADASAVSFADNNDIATSTASGYTEYIVYDQTNKCYWSNQQNGCLQGWTKSDSGERTIIASEINADGPKYNYFGFMKFKQGGLYSCDSYVWDSNRKACVQVLRNGVWTIFQDSGITEKTGTNFTDLLCLDVDINDPNHVFVGGKGGLYEFQNSKFIQLFNTKNSPIEPFNGTSNNYQLITGVTYDANGKLWCLNSQAPNRSILCYDGTQWQTYDQTDLMKLDLLNGMHSLGQIKNIHADKNGNLWFVNNHWVLPSFYCYQTQTNTITCYTNFENQNGTALNLTRVRCLAPDKEGNMWIGTDVGLVYLPYSSIENGEISIKQYIVSRNDGSNLGDYLLNGLDITCMTIDAANRKWYGTNGNGVYLISADNNIQEQHFLTDNSHLLSDYIESLAINEETGEVFIGTTKGLCSYMSDATVTNEEMNKDNVWAYPNPVKPDYNGLITITGLSYNADVKICTSNGVLVNEGRSTGGSYTWNGCDKDGKRVASGVYMVQTAKSDGSKGTVCKIAIVR